MSASSEQFQALCPRYERTQKAPFPQIMAALILAMAPIAWVCRHQPAALIVLAGVAVTLITVGLMFHTLTVRDEGEHLAIRFGPLPVLRKRIPYSAITSVQPGRSSIIDGWGIHWVPGRGTTYNLWGFGCALLEVDGRTVRIGSDDVENLVHFLRGIIQASN
jgi:hypothetical protein